MTSSRVSHSPYRLRLRAPFGPANSIEREGALLKVECEAGPGYACLQPWPELGEPTLAAALASIAGGVPLPIAARALDIAGVDAGLSAGGISPFADLDLGESHYLLGPSDLEPETVARLKDRGFAVLKAKADATIVERLAFLERDAGLRRGLKLRLDFNARLEPAEFERLLARFPESLASHVDFFEDPTRYDEAAWLDWNERYHARLALDRAPIATKASSDGRVDKGPAPFVVAVAKPAVEDEAAIRAAAADNMRRVVFTHNLDHAVGRAYALWALGRARAEDPLLLDESGFCGAEVYAPDPYLDRFRLDAPALVAPVAGPHWGFADALAREEWKPL